MTTTTPTVHPAARRRSVGLPRVAACAMLPGLGGAVGPEPRGPPHLDRDVLVLQPLHQRDDPLASPVVFDVVVVVVELGLRVGLAGLIQEDYRAGGIAGANINKVGWTAAAYATTSFVLPFAFCLSPGLLLQGLARNPLILACLLGLAINALASCLTSSRLPINTLNSAAAPSMLSSARRVRAAVLPEDGGEVRAEWRIEPRRRPPRRPPRRPSRPRRTDQSRRPPKAPSRLP